LWTYIRKENVDDYLNEYSKLTDIFNQICLLETQDACFLPRLMAVNFPSNKLVQYNGKKIVEAEPVQFKFKGTLRDNQIPIVKSILDYYKKNNIVNGIIKARPGIGKTVMAVYVSAKLGLKTCVVVDNSNLMEQWIKAIYDFTDLTENDIGIIKQKLTVTNKPVTVAMCQSLLSKLKGNISSAFEFVDESRFGLVWYDEVHSTSASENYAKASLLFRTRNVIGLSATPFQTGAQEILMKNTIGELIYETNEYETKPRYFLVYYDSGLGNKETTPGGKDYSKMLMRTGDFIRRKAMYNKIIIQSEKYLQLISSYTQNLVRNDHTVIIICFTKKQVTTISERLDKIGVVHRRYYGDEREIDKETDRVLVVTYSYCGKGFDFSKLSALIYATPLAGKKSIIQTTGRILRESEGKRQPVVVDLIDMAFPFISLKDVKIKVPVIQNEFQIPVEEHRENV
jgi:superfamily II DNA or RNA helicase